MLSEFSLQQLGQQLISILGEKLPEQELASYQTMVEIVEPPAAKQFWHSTNTHTGIYIVLTGKVRLLDSSGNLISTLEVGASFGEVTLFPNENFSPYAARASYNLKLCYLNKQILQILISKYPNIQAHLLARAESWERLLNSYQQEADTSYQDVSMTSGLKIDERKSHDYTSVPITERRKVIPFPSQTIAQPKQKRSRVYFPNPKVRVGQIWGRLTRRYPFFEQQSLADCGVACLVMIARYWGKRLSVNRLRELANVNRSGASLRALAAAAESIGFSTRPVKASFDKLAEQPLPAIAALGRQTLHCRV